MEGIPRDIAPTSAGEPAGAKVGVSGTPALFVNGLSLSGAQPFDAIAQVIDEELARAKAKG